MSPPAHERPADHGSNPQQYRCERRSRRSVVGATARIHFSHDLDEDSRHQALTTCATCDTVIGRRHHVHRFAVMIGLLLQ